jgi:hypothetical protein
MGIKLDAESVLTTYRDEVRLQIERLDQEITSVANQVLLDELVKPIHVAVGLDADPNALQASDITERVEDRATFQKILDQVEALISDLADPDVAREMQRIVSKIERLTE